MYKINIKYFIIYFNNILIPKNNKNIIFRLSMVVLHMYLDNFQL